MIKTREQALEEVHDKTMDAIVDGEIQIEYLADKNPKMVLRKEKKIILGRPAEVPYTVENALELEKSKLEENKIILAIVLKKLKEIE